MHKRSFLLLSLAALLLVCAARPLLAEGPTAAQYVGWGSQMLTKKNYPDAQKYFNAAVKADNKNAAAYKGLGFAMIGQGNKAQAMPYLKYSMRLNPGDAQLRNYLVAQGVTVPPALPVVGSMAPPASGASTTPATGDHAKEDASAPQAKVNPWVLGGTLGTAALVMILIL